MAEKDNKAFGALASGLAGSAFGFGLNSIASNISQANQLDMLRESNRLQRSNMQFANQLTRQNALDTPKLNRLGMEGAGFNVNAEKGFSPIAGQSGLGSSGQGASMSPVDLASFTSAMANANLAQSQAKNLDVDTEGKKIDIANKQEGYDVQFANIRAETDKLLKDIDYTSELTEYQRLQNSRYNEITDAEVKYTLAKVNDSIWTAKEREEHIEVFKKQIEEMDAHIRNLDADSSLTPERRQNLIEDSYLKHFSGEYQRVQAKAHIALVNSIIRKNTSDTNMSIYQRKALGVQILLAAKDLDWYEFDKIANQIHLTANDAANIFTAVKGKKITPVNKSSSGIQERRFLTPQE